MVCSTFRPHGPSTDGRSRTMVSFLYDKILTPFFSTHGEIKFVLLVSVASFALAVVSSCSVLCNTF